jgi:hypothetical protein
MGLSGNPSVMSYERKVGRLGVFAACAIVMVIRKRLLNQYNHATLV